MRKMAQTVRAPPHVRQWLAKIVTALILAASPLSFLRAQDLLEICRPDGSDGAAEVSCAAPSGTFCRLYESLDLVAWKVRATSVASEEGVSFAIPSHEEQNAFYRLEFVAVQPLPQMVWITPGEFMISSPTNEVGRFLDKEDPQTEVALTRGYWISRYEVTQREFQDLLHFNPSLFKGDPQRPVEDVSWIEAVRFCQQLTERERKAARLTDEFEYRLPTEAEWAFACRAGTTTRFSYGDDPGYRLLGNYAWYGANSALRPHPIGQKFPNPWGLYDLHGNVFEWTSDWYGPLPGGKVTDPQGATSGTDRVIRGGYWGSTPDLCRSAVRVHFEPTTRLSYLGFRIALSVTAPP